jgi:hypothetical protein
LSRDFPDERGPPLRRYESGVSGVLLPARDRPGVSYIYDDEFPEGEDWSQFEPYYGAWERSEGQDYYVCQYYLSPEAALSVVEYPSAPEFVYYYDPFAGQYIGLLERSKGKFRYWYVDDGRWSAPVTFPFSPPPPIDR